MARMGIGKRFAKRGDDGGGYGTDQGTEDGHGDTTATPPTVEATWWESVDGGPPLTELTAEMQGPLSPWGEDHTLPLPPEQVGYRPPTGRPNRAGNN